MPEKELITLIEQVYGVPIKYGNQCQQLSIEVLKQTGDYISFQTLRRFFGFISSTTKPSTSTLNTLSKFCGFRHFSEFCDSLTIKKSITDSFIFNHYNIPLRNEEDLNYHYVCRNMARMMYDNLALIEQNSTFLSTSGVAQEYFFERFVFIDHLNNPIYRRALLQYKKGKNTVGGKVFIDTILFLADYLSSNKIGKIPLSINLQNLPQLHPFLQARLIGTLLIGNTYENQELLELAFDYAEQQKNADESNHHFPFFHWMMADYFITVKMFEEAFTLIEEAKKEDTLQPTGWLETGYHETFDLLHAICLEALGQQEEAKESFDKIKKENFHFIFHRYFSIRYLNLKKKLFNMLSAEEETELSDLYFKTKFKYLV